MQLQEAFRSVLQPHNVLTCSIVCDIGCIPIHDIIKDIANPSVRDTFNLIQDSVQVPGVHAGGIAAVDIADSGMGICKSSIPGESGKQPIFDLIVIGPLRS